MKTILSQTSSPGAADPPQQQDGRATNRQRAQGASTVCAQGGSTWREDPRLNPQSAFTYIQYGPGLSCKRLGPPGAPRGLTCSIRRENVGAARCQPRHSPPTGDAVEPPALCPARRPWLTFHPRRKPQLPASKLSGLNTVFKTSFGPGLDPLLRSEHREVPEQSSHHRSRGLCVPRLRLLRPPLRGGSGLTPGGRGSYLAVHPALLPSGPISSMDYTSQKYMLVVSSHTRHSDRRRKGARSQARGRLP